MSKTKRKLIFWGSLIAPFEIWFLWHLFSGWTPGSLIGLVAFAHMILLIMLSLSAGIAGLEVGYNWFVNDIQPKWYYDRQKRKLAKEDSIDTKQKLRLPTENIVLFSSEELAAAESEVEEFLTKKR